MLSLNINKFLKVVLFVGCNSETAQNTRRASSLFFVVNIITWSRGTASQFE